MFKLTHSVQVRLVDSIELFWFYFVSFSYNGVYFLRFIFNRTLAQYLSGHFEQNFRALRIAFRLEHFVPSYLKLT